MKILFTVEFYEPHKGGAEEVVRQLSERFAAAGHNVTVATTFLAARKTGVLNGVKIESFKLSGTLARGIGGGQEEVLRYQTFLQSGFDVVINYAAQIWTTDLALDVLPKIQAKKILVPCGYPDVNNPLFKEYFEKLAIGLKQYDKLVYMSPNYQDKFFGDKQGVGDKAVIIPNAAAAEEFLHLPGSGIRQKLGITTKFLAICVANHYRDKGHDFVIDAFLRAGRSDTTLLIIGENPGANFLGKIKQLIRGCYKSCAASSLLHKNIKLMRGNNRSDVLSAYKDADVFLFGSKVECAPLVMYEAFASKTLFISTPVGNIQDHKEAEVLVKTPEQMAEQLNFYLGQEQKRQELIEKAFILWQTRHTWDVIFREYELLINEKN